MSLWTIPEIWRGQALRGCVHEGGAMPEDEMHMSVLADEFPDTSYQTIVYYGMVITKP